MNAATVAVVLVSIAGGMILIGITLFVIGLFWEARRTQGLEAKSQSFPELLGELIKKLFKIIFSRSAAPKKLQAFGMLLILLGIGFLLASGISAIWSAIDGTGGGSPSTPPTDSASPTPTSS